MTAWLIPTSTDVPHFSEQVELDGTLYTLAFQWNEREARWYLHLYADEDEVVPLRLGVKLVPGFPLFWRELRPGYLFAKAPGGLQGAQSDLGRLQLFYIDEDGA